MEKKIKDIQQEYKEKDDLEEDRLPGRCVRRQSFYQGIVRSFISMIPRNYRRQDVSCSMMRSWKKQLQ